MVERRRRSCALVAGLVVILAALSSPHAGSDPILDGTATNGSRLESINRIDERSVELSVYSAAMERTVGVRVQLPADASVPRPTLYVLDSQTRNVRTDALQFLADKNVNVVMPTGGENAYWTDWQSPDPALGVNKWETFLTSELPPIVDENLKTNGRNAVAGMSRTGTAALDLATNAPGLFAAVASYSGCPQTSDPLGQAFVRLSMREYGGGDPANMWGSADDPAWSAHDPYLNAERLRGTDVYISTGNGLPGRWERLDAPGLDNRADLLFRQAVAGGGIEAVINYCTQRFADRLRSLGIPATFDFRSTGTHSWGYWQDDFKDSWPILARGLGL